MVKGKVGSASGSNGHVCMWRHVGVFMVSCKMAFWARGKERNCLGLRFGLELKLKKWLNIGLGIGL